MSSVTSQMYLKPITEVVNGLLDKKYKMSGRRNLLHQFWIKFPAAYTGTVSIKRINGVAGSNFDQTISTSATLSGVTEYIVNDLNWMFSNIDEVNILTSTTCSASSTVYMEIGYYNNGV